jgi:protein TonB
MLAYAANSRRIAGRSASPKALVLIVAGHAALIAAVMAAKMEVVTFLPGDPTDLINIAIDPPPLPPPQDPTTKPRTAEPSTQLSFIDRADSVVDMDTSLSSAFSQGATIDDINSVIGTDIYFVDPPKPAPVRTSARFSTPASALRPPYPADKLRLEQEATLKLRLIIDARGRVTAVDPVGAADPSFLEAARRHIIRAWRYKPATEDGIAVGSSAVITLSFRLEEA